MPYGDVITRSWTIFWRHRYVWLLGALGGAFGSTCGSPGFSGNFSDFGRNGPNAMNQWFMDHAGFLIAVGVTLGLLLLVYVLVVGSIAAGALVRAAAEHDAERPFDLGQAWQAGLRTFLPVLGLRIVAFLCFLLVLLVFGALVFILVALGIASVNSGRGGGVALVILAGIVVLGSFVLVAIAFQLVVTLSTLALVLEQRGVLSALGRGIALFIHRMGRVLIVWLIAIPISIVVAVAVYSVTLILGIPLLLIGVATFTGLGVDIGLTVAILLVVLFSIATVLLSGAVQSYFTIYWTVAFRRLELEAPPMSAYAPYGPPPAPA
jgi:hypothetical protein